MSLTLDEMIAAAKALPPESRAKLADEMLASIDSPARREIDDAWAAEAERRLDEYESGGVKTIPADEVLRPRRPGGRP